jgi:hypothetical protein
MSEPNITGFMTAAKMIVDSGVMDKAVSDGVSLGEAATKAANEWCGPLTQNHDPAFWKILREAYASGFMRGFNECATAQREIERLQSEVRELRDVIRRGVAESEP